MTSKRFSHLVAVVLLAATLTTCSETTTTAPAADPVASDTTLAEQLFARADSLLEAARYDSALVYFEKASLLYEEDGDWEGYVRCYNKMGEGFRRKGNLQAGMERVDHALEVGKSELGEGHPEIARSYQVSGIIQFVQGQREAALELWNKALGIRISALGDRHPDVANSYNNIGVYHFHRGDFKQALFFHNKALTIRRAALDEQHLALAQSYNNIGTVYQIQLDYDQALNYHNKALAIRRSRLGEHNPGLISSYINIGILYNSLDKHDQALFFLDKALRIQLDSQGELNARTALIYHNIGLVHQVKGEYDQVLNFYNRALSIRLAMQGEQHPNVATTYINISKFYRDNDDYNQALFFLNKALTIQRALQGEKGRAIAQTYNDIGTNYRLKGDYDRALSYYQRALQVMASGFTETDPHVNPSLDQVGRDLRPIETFREKGEALLQRYRVQRNFADLEAAHATHQLAVELVDQVRTGFSSEGSKLNLSGIDTIWGLFIQAIQTSHLLHRVTRDQNYLLEAVTFAEKRKATILHEALMEAQAKRFGNIPDSLLEQERQLRIDLTFYEQQIVQEQQKRERADLAKISLWQGTSFDLKQRYDTLLTRFEQQYPDYYRLKYNAKTASVQDVQERILADTTALIEYFLGTDSLYTFVVTQDTLAVHAAVRASSLAETIDSLSAHITQWTGSRNVSPGYVQAARALYKTLLEPVEALLRGRTHLIIVPDSNLSYVPFEALLTQEVARDGEGMRHSELPYLIKEYTVSYTYSATLLLGLIEQAQRRKQPRRDFIAFAPVEFAGDDSTAQEDTRRQGFLQAFRTRGLFDEGPLPALPDSETEVNGILKLFEDRYGLLDRLGAFFSGRRAEVLIRSDANESRLKQLPLDQYRFVHFATHAGANADNGLLSAIVLPVDTTKAASDSSSKAEDGLLYLSEVYALRLNAEMVVLSACETGLGEILTGEGVIGLTRGFLYAGSSSVLVSQWSVGDEDTAKLMVGVYRQLLEGASRATALRAAKLALIAENAPPRSWSAFVLVGLGA